LKVLGQRNEDFARLTTQSVDENLKFISATQEQEIRINDGFKSVSELLTQIQSQMKETS
jgi:hypothetical protein